MKHKLGALLNRCRQWSFLSDFSKGKFLESRLILLLLSFSVALGLWLFVVGGRDESVSRDIDTRLEFLNVPSGMIVNPSVRSVTVTFKGERRAMDLIDNGSYSCDVDLKGLKAGITRLPIHVPPPHRVEVVQVSPATVDIELVKVAEKTVPLKVISPPDMPAGHAIRVQSMDVDSVRIKGSEDALSKVDFLELHPRLDELKTQDTIVLAPQWQGKLPPFEMTPSLVKLRASLSLGMPEAKVRIKLDPFGHLPPGLQLDRVEISPQMATVEAPQEMLKRKAVVVRTEPVDLSALEESTTLTLKVVPPEEPVRLKGPNFVQAKITLSPLGNEHFLDSIPVAVEGEALKKGKWRVEPSTVKVRLQVSSSAPENLTIEDLGLKAYVDVTNLVSRSLRLPIRFSYEHPEWIVGAKAEPVTVKVTMGEE